MAHNRLEKIGTIYSRITGLVRTGAMKLEDRPIWYQVYQSFPPEQEPTYDRPIADIPIRQIFYPEDIVRAKFYKKVNHLPVTNLSDRKELTLLQKCINLCFQIQKEKGIKLEEAFDEAFEMLNVNLIEEQFQASRQTTKETTISPSIKISNILEESK